MNDSEHRLTVDELKASVTEDTTLDELIRLIREEEATSSPRTSALRFLRGALTLFKSSGPDWKSRGRCPEHFTVLWEGRVSGNEDPLFCADGLDGGHYVELTEAVQD